MSFIFKVNTARRKQHFVAFSTSRRDSNGPGHILRRRCSRKVRHWLRSTSYKRWTQTPQSWTTCLPMVLLANGRAPEAEAALQTLIAQHAATDAFYIAVTYAYRNEKQLALNWLERAYAQRDDGLLEMMGEPLLKNISAEPRFHAVLRAMNLPDYV